MRIKKHYGGIYYIFRQRDGRTVRHSLETRNYEEAKKRAWIHHKLALMDGSPESERLEYYRKVCEQVIKDIQRRGPHSTFRIHDLVDVYKQHPKFRGGPRTVEVYQAVLNRFYKFLETKNQHDIPVCRIPAETFEQYFKWMEAQDLAPKTISHSLVVMKTMWKRLKEDCGTDPEVFSRIAAGSQIKIRNKRRNLTPDEVYRLSMMPEITIDFWGRGHGRGDKRLPYKEAVVVTKLAMFSGLRVADIMKLKWTDYLPDKNMIICTPGKTEQHGMEARIPLFGPARESIRQLYEERMRWQEHALKHWPDGPRPRVNAPKRPSGMRWLPSCYNYCFEEKMFPLLTSQRTGEIFDQQCADAFIQTKDYSDPRGAVVFHSLRHTIQTILVEEKVPQPYIDVLTGRRSPGSAAGYTHISDERLCDVILGALSSFWEKASEDEKNPFMHVSDEERRKANRELASLEVKKRKETLDNNSMDHLKKMIETL